MSSVHQGGLHFSDIGINIAFEAEQYRIIIKFWKTRETPKQTSVSKTIYCSSLVELFQLHPRKYVE